MLTAIAMTNQHFPSFSDLKEDVYVVGAHVDGDVDVHVDTALDRSSGGGDDVAANRDGKPQP